MTAFAILTFRLGFVDASALVSSDSVGRKDFLEPVQAYRPISLPDVRDGAVNHLAITACVGIDHWKSVCFRLRLGLNCFKNFASALTTTIQLVFCHAKNQ